MGHDDAPRPDSQSTAPSHYLEGSARFVDTPPIKHVTDLIMKPGWRPIKAAELFGGIIWGHERSRENGLPVADWTIYVRNASPDLQGPREAVEATTALIQQTYAKTDQRRMQINA